MKLAPEPEKVQPGKVILAFLLIGLFVGLVKFGLETTEEIDAPIRDTIYVQTESDTVYMHDTMYVTRYVQQQEDGQENQELDATEPGVLESL